MPRLEIASGWQRAHFRRAGAGNFAHSGIGGVSSLLQPANDFRPVRFLARSAKEPRGRGRWRNIVGRSRKMRTFH